MLFLNLTNSYISCFQFYMLPLKFLCILVRNQFSARYSEQESGVALNIYKIIKKSTKSLNGLNDAELIEILLMVIERNHRNAFLLRA